jgi:Protein of unknown function (DUF3311)
MKHIKPRDKSPVTWLAVTILLVFAIGAALWVPLYARTQPKLGPFPFFYWYQLMLMPVVAIAGWLSYLMLRPSRPKETRRNPTSSGGRPLQGPKDTR